MLNTLVLAAAETAEHHAEPAVHPYVIGVIAFAILLFLLFVTMAFGGGRDHS